MAVGAREVPLNTWLMEYRLTKNRIPELYLNISEWGHGVFDLEAAAQRSFHKPAPGLSMEEGVRLAAVILRPLRHRPTETISYVEKKKIGSSGGCQCDK